MALIFVSSSASSPPGLPSLLSDKEGHGLLYAGLASLALRALARGRWAGVTASTTFAAILVSTMYGVTDEAHQRFVPGRVVDWQDLVADALGSAAGAGAIWTWGILTRKRP